jgi:hypothetical protein
MAARGNDAGRARDVIEVRLEAILAYIQRLRANLYPADWTADPLYRIEQEIVNLLDDVKHG